MDLEFLAAADDDFYSMDDRMVCTISAGRLEPALQVLYNKNIPMVAMEQDLERYKNFQGYGRTLAETASAILKLTGRERTDGSRYLTGKTYEMIQTPNALIISKAQGENKVTLLEVKNGYIKENRVTVDDCRNFLDMLKKLQKLNVEKKTTLELG
ncbi:MAG: hypothetical protein F6K09_30505 [Merismopedia sp. SIO2A8]|nr:hypothetical protein [Merismopedia sp. SIO2A8]